VVNPYAEAVGPGNPTIPDQVAGQAFSAGELSQFGVPTAITLSTRPAPVNVTYPDPTNPALTRSTTVPVGAVQTVATITYEVNLGGSFTAGYNATQQFNNAAFTHTGNVVTTSSSGISNELNELVDWSSSNDIAVQMLNIPYFGGIAIPLTTTAVTLKATLLGKGGTPISGQLSYTPGAISPHTLQSLQISPRNQIYGTSNAQPASGTYPYTCTGFYADGTLAPLAGQVQWSATSNQANITFVQNGSGVNMELDQPAQDNPTAYNVTLTATFPGGLTDSTTIQIVPQVRAH